MEVKDKKYEEELAEDIMKILTCYSARYYGARGGRKKKIKVENEPVEGKRKVETVWPIYKLHH
jgi:predicted site-specific integrase-resolvase